jgi:hypothetical protein
VTTAAATALLAGGFAPAAFADDTDVTFTLDGGDLTLSVGGIATLTDEDSGVEANTITGTLGEVAVTDARGGTAGWVTSAASTTFTGFEGSLSESIGVAYTNGTVTETGTNTVAAASALSITSVQPVATATVVSGNNTASWDPTLDVSMPAGALAGDYFGTVTTSLV